MAGIPISDTEVQRAAGAIKNAGFTWQQGQKNTCGRIRISRILSVSLARAEAILRRLRGQGLSPPPPSDCTEYAIPQENLDPVAEHKLKTENTDLRRQLNEALSKHVLDQRYQEFIAEVAATPSTPQEWAEEPKPGRPKQAIPLSHLSDGHFDEIVDPAQVNYMNGYGRKIGRGRLKRFFQRTIRLCDDYLKGVDYPGIIMPMSGDLFSGAIHDELRETNEASLCESLRYWIDHLEAGIKMFAERFGRVYIPVVVGNHPRQTMKPRAKGGVRDNFDWLLAAMLKRDFARSGDKRVTFHISDSFDSMWKAYGVRYLQTHGDQFKGGTGIAAALSPMLLGDTRKREKHTMVHKPYDVLIMGHWHYRMCLPTVKANGSIVGYNEYAASKNLKFQEPLQSFWLTTPEHGITVEAPIFVQDPKEEWCTKQKDAVAFAA